MTTHSSSSNSVTPFSKFPGCLSQKSALRFQTNPLGSPSRRPPPPTRPSFLSESKTSLLRPLAPSTPVSLSRTKCSKTAPSVCSNASSVSDRKNLSRAYNADGDVKQPCKTKRGNLSPVSETLCSTSAARDDGLKSSPTRKRSSSVCVKDLEQTVEDLRKENFDIKLRLFHFEENMGRKRGDDENDDDDDDEKENYIVTKNAKPDNGVANLFEENGKLKVELTRTATVMQHELQEAYIRIRELEAYAGTHSGTNDNTERELRDDRDVYCARINSPTPVELEETQEARDRLYQEVTRSKTAKVRSTMADSEDIVQSLQISSGTRRHSTVPQLCDFTDDRRERAPNDMLDDALAEMADSKKRNGPRENSFGDQRTGKCTEAQTAQPQHGPFSRMALEVDTEKDNANSDTRSSSEYDFVLVDTGDLEQNEECFHPAIVKERHEPQLLDSPSTSAFQPEGSVVQNAKECITDGLDSPAKLVDTELPGDGHEPLLTEGSFHIDDPFPQLGNDWDGDPEKPFHGTATKEPIRKNLSGFGHTVLPPVCIEEHAGIKTQSTSSGLTVDLGSKSIAGERTYGICSDGSQRNTKIRRPMLPDPLITDDYPSLFRPIETPRMVTFGEVYRNPPKNSISLQTTPPSARRLSSSMDEPQTKQTALNADNENRAYMIYPVEALHDVRPTQFSPIGSMTGPQTSTLIPTPTYHTPYTRERRQTTNPSYNRRSFSPSSSTASSGSGHRSSISLSPTTNPSSASYRRTALRAREREKERADLPGIDGKRRSRPPSSCESRGEFDFLEDIISRVNQLERISDLLQDQLSSQLGL